MENISCLVSDILDCIGYSQDIINVRRNYWQQHSRFFNVQNERMTLLIAGSKAEGTTSIYENDIDKMFLYNDAICTDDIQHWPPVPDMTVLHTDTSEAPPGYTRLRLIRCNGAVSRPYFRESAYESEARDVYVSSSLFTGVSMQRMRRTISKFTLDELSGPAVAVHGELFSFDCVSALPCYHSKFLRTWKSRQRLHNWPPADVRESSASMLAQLVPVGSKGSCDQWREWRFCFIGSELKLTFSLNETQVKLYILLKMVAKSILKNVSNEILSYIMKNVTFWLSELLPEDVFRKDNLMPLLCLALRFLKSAISKWNWLPYYMIPGRNLLSERLSYGSRRQLSNLIGTLIDEGPQLLLRCNKLQIALIVSVTSPASLVDYRSRRNMIEMLTYLRFILKDGNTEEFIISQVKMKMYDLVLPEHFLLYLSGIPKENIKSIFHERMLAILS